MSHGGENVAGSLILTVGSCASFSTSELGETRDASADGGGNDGGADVVAPRGCDLTKGPKDSTSCIVDAVGVFVSPTGDDGAAGTKGAPVKTIAKGVDVAATKGLPRV